MGTGILVEVNQKAAKMFGETKASLINSDNCTSMEMVVTSKSCCEVQNNNKHQQRHSSD